MISTLFERFLDYTYQKKMMGLLEFDVIDRTSKNPEKQKKIGHFIYVNLQNVEETKAFDIILEKMGWRIVLVKAIVDKLKKEKIYLDPETFEEKEKTKEYMKKFEERWMNIVVFVFSFEISDQYILSVSFDVLPKIWFQTMGENEFVHVPQSCTSI